MRGALDVPVLSGPPRTQVLYLLSLALLGFGTGLLALALSRERLRVAAAAAGAAGVVAWLLTNGAGEVRTLWVVLPGNGLTVADLAAAPALALLAAVVLRDRRAKART